jgi:hypothetical protein
VGRRVLRLSERLQQIIVARYGLDGQGRRFYRRSASALASVANVLANCTAKPWSGCAISLTHNTCVRCWLIIRWPTTNGLRRKYNIGYGGEQGDIADARSSPSESRAQDRAFVRQCSFAGLRPRLPLRWPTPPGMLDSPKKQYRSHYLYLGYSDLYDSRSWRHLSSFDLVLWLVDFGALRPVLA